MSVILEVVERFEDKGRSRLLEYVGPSNMPGFSVARDERGRIVEVAEDTVRRVIREEKIGEPVSDLVAGAVVLAEQAVGGDA